MFPHTGGLIRVDRRVPAHTQRLEILMNKLKLDVEALRIDAFEVEAVVRDADGTVIAHGLLSGTLYTTTAVIRYCPNMPDRTENC